ncbi:hypothetical protein B8W90_11405, partial [Staphylococcus hominis]
AGLFGLRHCPYPRRRGGRGGRPAVVVVRPHRGGAVHGGQAVCLLASVQAVRVRQRRLPGSRHRAVRAHGRAGAADGHASDHPHAPCIGSRRGHRRPARR